MQSWISVRSEPPIHSVIVFVEKLHRKIERHRSAAISAELREKLLLFTA